MPGPLSGPGIGLNLPQYLYPSELNAAPYDAPTNQIALAPGDQLPVPAGTWYVALGFYLVLQFLDPVTGTWKTTSSSSYNRGVHYVKSDGFNCRVANLTGCPTGAAIVAQGSNYVQASTQINVTGGGGSTWSPVVGGQLGFASVVTANAGAGYGVAPLVFIPAPPPASSNVNGVGGVQATGYCGIASGTVSGFTFTNPGAGYTTAPTPVVLPNPTDPNINTGITAATLSFSIVTGGGLAGVLCTNNGAALSNPNNITLTVSGAGSAASLSVFSMQTITKASVTGAGTIAATTAVGLVTFGGVPPAGGINNAPEAIGLAWLPRPAQVGFTVNGAGTLSVQTATIYDGGLFNTNAAPSFALLPQQPLTTASLSVTSPTIALTMGSTADFVVMQPAP